VGNQKKVAPLVAGPLIISDGLLSAYRRRQRRELLPLSNGSKQRPLIGEGGFMPKGSLLYPGMSIPYATDRVNELRMTNRAFPKSGENLTPRR